MFAQCLRQIIPALRRSDLRSGTAVILVLFLALATGCTTNPRIAPITPIAETRPFANEINAFIAADRTNPPLKKAILFVGSSSIRLWKTLAQDFPEHRVINRGFGGSQIVDSVNYADHIVLPYRPRQIVMYAGGNDLNAKKSPQEVFSDYQAFVQRVHAVLPQTEITYISIAPNPARWAQIDRVREANRLIQAYSNEHAGLSFIDIHPHMLGKDGQPKPELFVADRLHMSANGYVIWREVVRPHLHR